MNKLPWNQMIEPGETSEVMKMLEALIKQVESSEKKKEANGKKVETYNSRVNQIPRAPQILKGPDSKEFVQKPFLLSAVLKQISKRSKRIIDQEPRLVRDRYQLYGADQRENKSGHHPTRNNNRNDQGPSNRGLMRKSDFDRLLRGSSANIIRRRVVEQLGLSDQVIPTVWMLYGFNTACETTKGEITLQVNTTRTTQETKFYMIEGDMRYNSLFGKPWVHSMRAVPSALHQSLKFPTLGGVKTIYGEHSAAKKMFDVDKVILEPVVST
ncbi:PREDICTED: uncharacterized protein LOC109224167 [Nicotiana attenuata]|uniref:uncharacterized protein LOC109224167 n=1 Tax=Nicotiana attenuata TaxID=49451 RepID=UPI0009056A89|nr:PREDICTED: uncharacterized protein LOC109224167 [Nicotiana attenuata]